MSRIRSVTNRYLTNVIENGTRVNTPLGCGEVAGEESFYGGKLVRILVRLDDPSKWAFGRETDIAAFFEREIHVLDMDNQTNQSPRKATSTTPPIAGSQVDRIVVVHSPCRICGCAPDTEFWTKAGHVMFCPTCRSNGVDGLSVQTFPWTELSAAEDEWEFSNAQT